MAMSTTEQETSTTNHDPEIRSSMAVSTTEYVANILDQSVVEIASFNQRVQGPRRVAGLYFYTILDCLVDLAYSVSCDFFKRPRLYTNLAVDGQAKTIAELHARYGSDERFLSKAQRFGIYEPMFGHRLDGSIDGAHHFQRLAHELIKAATAFAERQYGTGEDMLREAISERILWQFTAMEL
jgi:hypothetical protein